MNGKEYIINEIISPLTGLYSSSKLELRNKDIGKAAEKSEINQRFKEHRINKKKFSKIKAKDLLSSIQIDLADVSQLNTVNKGINYLFMIIDVYSRYLWVYPIKNKSSKTTSEIFKQWLKEVEEELNKKVLNVNMDDGSEWKAEFKRLLDNHNITSHISVASQTSTNVPHKQEIVERVIRTIRTLIDRY